MILLTVSKLFANAMIPNWNALQSITKFARLLAERQNGKNLL